MHARGEIIGGGPPHAGAAGDGRTGGTLVGDGGGCVPGIPRQALPPAAREGHAGMEPGMLAQLQQCASLAPYSVSPPLLSAYLQPQPPCR